MKIRTSLKAGRVVSNHNETVASAAGVAVRTQLKAGRIVSNHSEALATSSAR